MNFFMSVTSSFSKNPNIVYININIKIDREQNIINVIMFVTIFFKKYKLIAYVKIDTKVIFNNIIA